MLLVRLHTVYILKHLLLTGASVTVALAGVAWLSQSLRFLDFIINQGLSIASFLKLTMLLVPSILVVILPVATLCTVIYTYTKFTADRELVIMRAAGISNWGLARPVFILCAICTGLGFLLSLYLSPAGFRTFKDEQAVLRADFSHMLLQEGVFNNLKEDFTVFVMARDREGRLQNILVQDSRNPEQDVTMLAEWGNLIRTGARPLLMLGNGSRQEVSTADRSLRMLYFDSYVFDLTELVGEPSVRTREPKERYLDELVNDPRADDDGRHRAELLAEAHRRMVTPFNAVALALIGLAAMVAGQFDRRQHWPRIAWGIAGGLAYIGISFSLAGLVTKNPAALGPYYAFPFVCCALSLWIMTRYRLAWPAWLRGVAANPG